VEKARVRGARNFIAWSIITPIEDRYDEGKKESCALCTISFI
jgi:hypothetical protein